MSSIEHKALAEFFVSSVYTALIPILLWIIYGLKIHHFNVNVMRRNENLFLNNLVLFPVPTRVSLMVIVIINQFLPVVVYGIFLLGMAMQHGKFESFVALTVALLSIMVVLTTMFHA